MLGKDILFKKYNQEQKSLQDIADEFDCSVNTVRYWMLAHAIPRRTRSESVYLKNNPTGDPFTFSKPKTIEEAVLYGLGIGLYWGEGNKKNNYSIRLGNTDPELVDSFIRFLEKFFAIPRAQLRFSLQIFSDVNPVQALKFWAKKLKIKENQFSKTTITQSRGVGTYREKNENGVLTVYFHNMKARDRLVSLLHGGYC